MSNHSKIPAILLAGDRGPTDPVAAAVGLNRKALVPVNGVPMLARVIGTLRDSGAVERILVVANACHELKTDPAVQEAAAGGDVEFLEGAQSPATSILKILEPYSGLFPVLIATADNPLLRPEVVADFVARSGEVDCDATLGVAAMTAVKKHFPDASRTFIRLRGEGYSGCNLFCLKHERALAAVQFWTELEKDRKKALRFVAAFGLGTMFRVLFRSIGLEAAVARASRVIGIDARPLVLDAAEAAMDVDKPEHLVMVEAWLAAQAEERA
jgi:GTP:adenosylcobinamide-phosphate guanylyltransferase